MFNDKLQNSKIAFALFAKTPELGQVKTRLAANIGEKLALELHLAFIADSLENVSKLNRLVDFYLYLTKPWDFAISKLPVQLEKKLFTIKYQSSGNLGNRLEAAFLELFSKYSSAIIIGTDSPNIPTSYLEEAILALSKYDSVIGPTIDGGYYLIGLKNQTKNFQEIFSNINWSTETVFQETIKEIETLGLSFFKLPTWYDIDTVKDLDLLRKDLINPNNRLLECPNTQELLKIAF